jgi:hypothetical protein
MDSIQEIIVFSLRIAREVSAKMAAHYLRAYGFTCSRALEILKMKWTSGMMVL